MADISDEDEVVASTPPLADPPTPPIRRQFTMPRPSKVVIVESVTQEIEPSAPLAILQLDIYAGQMGITVTQKQQAEFLSCFSYKAAHEPYEIPYAIVTGKCKEYSTLMKQGNYCLAIHRASKFLEHQKTWMDDVQRYKKVCIREME